MLEAGADLTVLNTTLEAITRTQEEPKDLFLARAPLTIVSQRREAGLEVIAAFGVRLSTGNLYRFLRRASGDKFDPGIYDAFADARAVDRDSWTSPNTYYGAAKEDGTHYSLDEMHRGLGEAWAVSELHRRDILEALKDADPGRKDAGPPEIHTGFISRAEILRNCTDQVINSRYFVGNALLKQIFVQFSADELRHILKMSKSRNTLTKKEKKMGENQLSRKILFGTHHSPVVREIFTRIPKWQAIVDRAIEEGYNTATFVYEGKELTYYKKKNYTGIIEDEIEPVITRRYSDRDVVYMARVTDAGVVYIKSEVISEMTQPSLVPVIHLTEKGGQLRLQTEPISDHPFLEAISASQPGLLNDNTTADSLLGLLTVAYFSPEITKKWPARMHSPHGLRTQFMGPLQVLVLGPMRRLELSQAKLVPLLASAGRN